MEVDIVFDGPPSLPAPRFVEVEALGKSISFGKWILRDDSMWVLRFIDPTTVEELGMSIMTCEAHPWLDWPHGDCIGPGMPIGSSLSLLKNLISGSPASAARSDAG